MDAPGRFGPLPHGRAEPLCPYLRSQPTITTPVGAGFTLPQPFPAQYLPSHANFHTRPSEPPYFEHHLEDMWGFGGNSERRSFLPSGLSRRLRPSRLGPGHPQSLASSGPTENVPASTSSTLAGPSSANSLLLGTDGSALFDPNNTSARPASSLSADMRSSYPRSGHYGYGQNPRDSSLHPVHSSGGPNFGTIPDALVYPSHSSARADHPRMGVPGHSGHHSFNGHPFAFRPGPSLGQPAPQGDLRSYAGDSFYAENDLARSYRPFSQSSTLPAEGVYAADSYAGLMTSGGPAYYSGPSMSNQTHSDEAENFGGLMPSSSISDVAQFHAYLASGSFERNVAGSYDNDNLTQAGQPLQDLNDFFSNPHRASEDVRRSSARPLSRPRRNAGVPRDEMSAGRSSQRGRPTQFDHAPVRGVHSRMTSRAVGIFDYGTGSQRAARHVVESLQDIDVNSLEPEDRYCTICMEELAVPEPVEGKTETPVRLPCGHVFGKTCITIWFGEHCTCPSCRRKVEAEYYVPESSSRRSGGLDTFRNRVALGGAGSAAAPVAPMQFTPMANTSRPRRSHSSSISARPTPAGIEALLTSSSTSMAEDIDMFANSAFLNEAFSRRMAPEDPYAFNPGRAMEFLDAHQALAESRGSRASSTTSPFATRPASGHRPLSLSSTSVPRGFVPRGSRSRRERLDLGSSTLSSPTMLSSMDGTRPRRERLDLGSSTTQPAIDGSRTRSRREPLDLGPLPGRPSTPSPVASSAIGHSNVAIDGSPRSSRPRPRRSRRILGLRTSVGNIDGLDG